MTNYVEPTPDSLAPTLHMLYGNEATVEHIAEDVSGDFVSVYTNDDDGLAATISCDLRFAAFAGSALTRIPLGGAEDAIADGELSQMMLSNLREVMNIASRWLMDDESDHLKLDEVYAREAAAPECGALADASSPHCFSVSVPGYGAGSIKIAFA